MRHLIESGLLTIASACGTAGSYLAQVDPDLSDSVAKWPLTLVLAAVAVVAIYFNFKLSQAHSLHMIKQSEVHAAAVALTNSEHREDIKALSAAVKSMAHQLAKQPCARQGNYLFDEPQKETT
jgi:hypothetical protein